MGLLNYAQTLKQDFDNVFHKGQLETLNKYESLQGNISDKVITINDVSPIEHDVNCKVRSKNLLNPRVFVDTSNGGHVTINEDGRVYLYSESGKEITTEITYTFDVTEKSVLSLSGYGHSNLSIFIDDQNTTEDHKVLDIGTHTLRLYIPDSTSATVYIQLEKGTTVTEYTPYTEELGSIKVSKYGKNLLNDAKRTKPSYGNVYFGTETSNGSITLSKGTYVFSVDIASGINPNVYVNKKDGTQIAVNYGKNYVPFTLTEQTDIIVKVYNGNITSAEQVYTAQIELGTNKTSYEPYIEPTIYHFNADGTPTEAIKSISPNMTLISNNDNVVINAHYYKDPDLVFSNLAQNIALSGGE